MFFNYQIDYHPSFLHKDIIFHLQNLIVKADKELKYGLKEAFSDIPINLVDERTLHARLEEIKIKYIEHTQKAKVSTDDEEHVVCCPDRYKYLNLLKETFVFPPSCLFVRKGVSSAGKEVLIIGEDRDDLWLLFIRTVYPLCWQVVKGKDFPLTNHPIHPLFFRYMQEPLAVAMTLAAVKIAFADFPDILQKAKSYFGYLPANYKAGILLHELKLHLRWKDWKDDKKRCEGKNEAMEHWVDILSGRANNVETEEVLNTWADLFDLTSAEVGAIMNAAPSAFAPVICESSEIHGVVIGLVSYASKHQDEFRGAEIMSSHHPLAERIRDLVTGRISVDDALYGLPQLGEQELGEFIPSHLPGWILSRDVKTGHYRIYGKIAMIGILKPANQEQS